MNTEIPAELGTLNFRCNLCGESVTAPMTAFGREQPSCAACSSTGRERAIIRALSLELFEADLAIPDFPLRPDLRGFGLSDSGRYATALAQKLGYENTFYHQEPRLDIAAETLPARLIESVDFIISSEVFEHVLPPVSQAFENVFQILKPGGVFVLTVPYGLQPATIEHFPELNDFTVIANGGGAPFLRNVTRDGVIEEFRNLVFHSGDGSTLEMRVFCEADLLRQLEAAGFKAIQIHRTPDFSRGICWPEPWSFPISARKPV